MKIALDYDHTYTADREFWEHFIKMSQASGHLIFIVTARSATRDKNDELASLERTLPVYYCDGVAKRWWCMHFGPGTVDVWIDDKPDNILNNSAFPFSDLQTWREECAANEPGHPGALPFSHAANCCCGYCT